MTLRQPEFLSFLLSLFLASTSEAFVVSPSFCSVRNSGIRLPILVTRHSPINFLDSTAVHFLTDVATTSSSTYIADASLPSSDYIPGTSGEVSYSRASYYVILGLYLTSFPGLWSVIKRSTSAKVKRKIYVSRGGNLPGGKNLREQAGEIMAYMTANNYEVVDAGETITFRGIVQRSTSQAFFLVFCAAVGLASLALVLQIQFQNFGTCVAPLKFPS
jgi:Cofactor assembly of complex C subunit B